MFDELKLIKECAKENKIAQKELYDRYCGIITGLCYRYLADRENAEDLMQDVFIKVLSNIKKFEWRGNGSLIAWIKRIAVNTCLKFLEKRNKKVKIVNISEELSIAEEHELNENSELYYKDGLNEFEIINLADLSEQELLNSLTMLPEPFRMVFNLHIIENYKHEEVAKILNINVKTSRTRLLRARKQLKDILYNFSLEKMSINTQWNETK